jgi:hypothetical protein
MQAIAFLLFAAGCLIAFRVIEVWWERRCQAARRRLPHARPMNDLEFREAYYFKEEEW